MPRSSAVDALGQSSEKFDTYSFRKYMNDFGRAYRNQAMELIEICRLFSRAAEQVFPQDAELTKILQVCDQALLSAAAARKKKNLASGDDINKAIRKLQKYELMFHSSNYTNIVKRRMEKAKEKDGEKSKKLKRQDDPLSKVVQFHIVKSLTDPQPTIVRQVLNNDSKLQEILWNFSRFNPERRLALSQSPHFYHLPTLPNVKWSEFNYRATEENWHTSHTQPIYVLTNTPGRVYLELGRNPWAFDNVWNTNETLIFKSVCGRLQGEGIVRASVQHSSWCHVEHLASEPEPGVAMVRLSQSNPSNNCVSVEKWMRELRQTLLSQNNPNVKIRISKCTEPTRGCGDFDEGSMESLKRTEGDSSLTRGESTGGYDVVGSNEGGTDSLERPEGYSPPTQGESTGRRDIVGSDEGGTESLEHPEGDYSLTREKSTGRHGILSSGEGSTESLERPEGDYSLTREESTRGGGIAGSDEGSAESLEWPGGFSPMQGEWTGVHDISVLAPRRTGLFTEYSGGSLFSSS